METFFPILTVCGLSELEEHGGRGITHVLSILDPQTPDPDFGRYPPHQRTTLRFDDIVQDEPGKVLPSREDVDAILAYGRSLADGTPGEGHLLVHCHAGISRSTAAMAILMAQAYPLEPEGAVVDRLVALRPQAWPNLRMIAFADEALGRDGRLVAAVAALYRRRLAARPELADGLARLGRSTELDLARQSAPSAPVP